MSGRVRNFRFRPCYEDGYVNFQKIFVLAHVIYGHCTRISAHEDFDFSFPFFVCHSRRTELADSSRIEKSEDYSRRYTHAVYYKAWPHNRKFQARILTVHDFTDTR